MSDARVIVDSAVVDWAGGVLRSTNRWSAGVWRDWPWTYVPWRAWAYKDHRAFGRGGGGLHQVRQVIRVEGCFPVHEPRDGSGPSDIEVLGDIILAEWEYAFFRTPIPEIDDAELELGEADVAAVVRKDDRHGGSPLGRAMMALTVTYARGRGNPYSREAYVAAL